MLCSQGLEIFGPYFEDPIKFLDPFIFLLFFVCEFAFHYYHHHAKRVCWLCHFCIIVDLLCIATPFPHRLWFLPFYIADLLCCVFTWECCELQINVAGTAAPLWWIHTELKDDLMDNSYFNWRAYAWIFLSLQMHQQFIKNVYKSIGLVAIFNYWKIKKIFYKMQ